MKLVNVSAIVASAVVFTACGGGSSEPDPCEDFANGKQPLFSGLACLGDAVDNKPAAVSEYEPNSTLLNANYIDAGAGTSIAGSVGGSDASDSFIITPAASGEYSIFLCDANCESPLNSDNLSLMVLDQTQSTIAATPIAVDVLQTLSTAMDAGLAYYIRVDGIARGDYTLAIVRQGAQ